jgi:hypothetical protein
MSELQWSEALSLDVLRVMREGLSAGASGRLDVIRQLAHERAAWFPQHAQTMDAALALHLRSVGFDPVSGETARPERLPAGAGPQPCARTGAGTTVTQRAFANANTTAVTVSAHTITAPDGRSSSADSARPSA